MKIKKSLIILAIAETVIASIVTILFVSEYRNARVIAGEMLTGDAGMATPAGRTISGGESAGMNALTVITLTNLVPGFYDLATVYSATPSGENATGRVEVVYDNDYKLSDNTIIGGGNRARTREIAFITLKHTNSVLIYRTVFSGAGSLTVHEVRVMRRYDAVNVLILSMVLLFVFWCAAAAFAVMGYPRFSISEAAASRRSVGEAGGEWDFKRSGLMTAGMAVFLVACFFALFPIPFAILFIAAFTLFIVDFIRDKHYRRLKLEAADYLLILFFLSAILSGLFAADKKDAIGAALVFLVYFSVMQLFRYILFDDPTIRKIAGVLALGLLVFNGLALVHFFAIRSHLLFQAAGRTFIIFHDPSTLISFLGQPTRCGYQIAIIMTIILGIFIGYSASMARKEKILIAASLAVSSAALVFTFSRGGMIFAVVSLLILLVMNKKKKALLTVLGVIVALSATLGILYLGGHDVVNDVVAYRKQTSTQLRQDQYEFAVDLFREHNPVIGVGLLNYRNYYNSVQDFEDIDFVHNMYLALLSETGLVGLILVLLFFIITLVILIRKSIAAYKMFYPIGISILVCLLITSLFDAIIYTVPIGIYIWIVLGLARNERRNNSPAVS